MHLQSAGDLLTFIVINIVLIYLCTDLLKLQMLSLRNLRKNIQRRLALFIITLGRDRDFLSSIFLSILMKYRHDVVIKCPHQDGPKAAVILFDSDSIPQRLKKSGYNILQLRLYHSKEFLEVLKLASKIRDAKNNLIAIHMDVWNKFCENVSSSNFSDFAWIIFLSVEDIDGKRTLS